ncbi:MAG: AI-2E family transporter [Lactobacillus sp.]|jgi:predicted PurR-regulated permease PerM|nr:AI-2E family transporter [Lactobacillus sp.]MCI2032894.1 AI-2E family transporter [Lactobacillus sp.]
MEKKASWFYRRFLNSKFTTAILNLLLVLLAVWVFTKIAWVFEPVMAFLRIVAPPFIFAGVLYYLLNPLVNWLNRFGLKRGWAIAIVFLVVLGLLGVAIVRFVPTIERQFTNILQSYPAYWRDFTAWLTDLNDHQDLISQRDLEQIGNELMATLTAKKGSLAAGTVAQLQNLVGIVGNVVVTVATAPIILFFMLKDGADFSPKFVALFPVKLRASIHQMLTEMNTKVGSYVQGQLTVAMAVAIIFMIGYSLIGLRFALILGLIAGPLNLIPYFGSALAMVPALIVGAVTSPQMLIAVIITFFVEWLLETQLISPLVMGSKLEMHPITIVIVLLTAGNLFGLAGVILGIPGFAVIKIVVTRFFSWYQQVSGLYDETKE